MKPGKIFAGLIMLSGIWTASCDRELISSGFPTVVINSVSGEGEALSLSASLMKNENNQVDATGFIWQIEEDPLVRPGFEMKCAAADRFDAVVDYSLRKGNNYIVRAYARCGQDMVYSEPMNFSPSADYPCTLGTFLPDNGYSGDLVTITGKGFNRSLVYNTVMFDSELATITEANDSVLKCTVPELASAGLKTIKVLVNGVESAFGSRFDYKVHEYPVIKSVSRKTVKYGTVLELYGKNLNKATQIVMNANSQSFQVTPVYSGSDTLKIEIYNQQNPSQLLAFSSFRIGLVYTGGIAWSEQISIVNSWTRLPDFPGLPRYKAGCFTINGIIYVGCGASNGATLKDLWRFDPVAGSWGRLADLPGLARIYPFSVAGLNSGYMGCGNSDDNSSRVQLYDAYKYDPATNSWSGIASYPDNIANFFIGYWASVNGRTFVGLSNTTPVLRELVNNSWSGKTGIADLSDNTGTAVFAIGNSFYVIAGYNLDGSNSREVWEYNTLNDTWTKKSNFPGLVRHVAISFSIGPYGYYGCGRAWDADVQYKDMWRYDPAKDKWIRLEDFPGGYRSHTVSASDGRMGYAGLGIYMPSVSYLKDFWKYNPE